LERKRKGRKGRPSRAAAVAVAGGALAGEVGLLAATTSGRDRESGRE
jgi:hypothetical protein